MAVTKRTRFEVLRRDEFRCQYCGLQAAETGTGLTIDHVVPVSLGGVDKPDNLVAACKDCNSGKSSIQPDAPIVTKLSAEASAYALGMIDKMTRLRADVQESSEYIDEFLELWSSWTIRGSDKTVELPADYELSLFRWAQMGVPMRVLEMAIPKAMTKPGLRGNAAEFSYMAGIVWTMINAREIDYSVTEETCAVFTEKEANDREVDAHMLGWQVGRSGGEYAAAKAFEAADFVTHHIDGTSSAYTRAFGAVA